MVTIALAALVALGPGSFAPDPRALSPEALLEPPSDEKDPCGGREGWVGDGEDGRGPPACLGPDEDADADAAGLHAPDWLWRVEDDPDAEDA